MNKQEILNILSEAEIILPVPEIPIQTGKNPKDVQQPEEPEQPQFYEEHAIYALSKLDLLKSNDDDDVITYVDFLESLLRIAAAYPFNDIPNNDIINLE